MYHPTIQLLSELLICAIVIVAIVIITGWAAGLIEYHPRIR